MRYLVYVFVLLVCCEAKYVPEDGVYAVTETMPTYKAGDSALNTYINEQVANTSINGKGSVFVSFVVTTNGEIEELSILNGVSADLDQEALRIIESVPGDWIPGTEEGKPVDVKMVYPIRF